MLFYQNKLGSLKMKNSKLSPTEKSTWLHLRKYTYEKDWYPVGYPPSYLKLNIALNVWKSNKRKETNENNNENENKIK